MSDEWKCDKCGRQLPKNSRGNYEYRSIYQKRDGKPPYSATYCRSCFSALAATGTAASSVAGRSSGSAPVRGAVR